MLANKNAVAMMQHFGGVGAILKSRGVSNLQSPTSRRTFYEYRAIQLPIQLALRQVSFLGSPEWIDPPWKLTETPSITHLHTVIDIAFSIPALMQRFDLLQHSKQALDDASFYGNLRGIKSEALAIQKAFNNWNKHSQFGDKTSQLYIARLSSTIEKPKIINIKDIYPISFTFPNWDAASALVYYEMSRIYLNSLLIDIDTCLRPCNSNNSSVAHHFVDMESLTNQSIACADRICQSLQFFFEDHDRMIGRMVVLAPFEVAKSLFTQLCDARCGDSEVDASLKRKLEFCEVVASMQINQ